MAGLTILVLVVCVGLHLFLGDRLSVRTGHGVVDVLIVAGHCSGFCGCLVGIWQGDGFCCVRGCCLAGGTGILSCWFSSREMKKGELRPLVNSDPFAPRRRCGWCRSTKFALVCLPYVKGLSYIRLTLGYHPAKTLFLLIQ